jgi:uncharacterized protein (TIGR02001 family)
MNFKVKSTLIIATLAASAASMAQTKAPEPDYTFSYNIGVVTDYRFRGISQTNFGTALQGGVDFAHKSGVYAGLWASNVDWIIQFNGASSGSTEIDFYAGFKGEITKDLGFDVGFITYQYPGNNSGEAGTFGAGAVTNASTTEFYGALTYSVATLKYSQSTGTFLGFLNSSTSNYLDLTLNFDLGNGLTLTPHIGRQVVKGQVRNLGDYSDYSISLAKDFGGGLSANIAAYGTNADQTFYANTNGNTNFLGKSGVAVGVKFSF